VETGTTCWAFSQPRVPPLGPHPRCPPYYPGVLCFDDNASDMPASDVAGPPARDDHHAGVALDRSVHHDGLGTHERPMGQPQRHLPPEVPGVSQAASRDGASYLGPLPKGRAHRCHEAELKAKVNHRRIAGPHPTRCLLWPRRQGWALAHTGPSLRARRCTAKRTGGSSDERKGRTKAMGRALQRIETGPCNNTCRPESSPGWVRAIALDFVSIWASPRGTFVPFSEARARPDHHLATQSRRSPPHANAPRANEGLEPT